MKNNDQHKLIFTSQRGQDLHEDFGCGVACMMMLLKHINVNPLPSWKELCAALNLEIMTRGYQKNDPAIGLYPEDLFRYVIGEKLHFRMHFFDNEWQKSLSIAPIMVMLDGVLEEFPEDAHWVVLTEFSERSFSYLDPWEKDYNSAEKHIVFDKFKQVYTGLACQLLDRFNFASRSKN